MEKIKSIVVFCASSSGNRPEYLECAQRTGKMLADKKIRMIYGGGKVGLMGAAADSCMQAGGNVVGIIPDFMTPKEIAHQGISELIVVGSMHERKLQMHEKSDAVITLPGGFGTFEELFEILTWVQLGIYQKPVGILNINGYYDLLEKQLDLMVKEGLLKAKHRESLYFSKTLKGLFDYFESFQPAPGIFRIDKNKT
ncbi:MAG: TIGR00730 family Rossman fold protein [Flavobacteriales bacterium]|nr:TIGR00730 family Rossman fold protein [Flavobacteriales bacterium]